MVNVKKIKHLNGHQGSIYALSEGINKGSFYSAGGDGWIVEWDILQDTTAGKLIAKIEGKIFCMEIIKSLNILVVGDMVGHVYFVDISQNKVLRRIASHSKGVFSIKYAEEQLISIGADGRIISWDLGLMWPKYSKTISRQGLRCAIFDKNLNTWWIGSSDCSIYCVDKECNVLHVLHKAHENSVFSLCYTPYGLISGGRDAALRRYEVTHKSITPSLSIHAHWYAIYDIKYLPQINVLITASRDKTIRLWDAPTLDILGTIHTSNGGHAHSVNTLLCKDGTNPYFISAGDDRSIHMYTCIKQ